MNYVAKLFVFFLFILLSNQGIAQTVSGTLIEKKTGLPLPYATASLLDSLNKPVTGVMTGETGTFVLGPVKPGSYVLECRSMGYLTITRTIRLSTGQKLALAGLALSPDAKTLAEVVVTGEKPALSILPDKKVFEVGKDVLSQNGSVSDVLNGIPSVSVSPQGQVSLRGNPGVVVLINGRRSGLVQGNALEQLQAAQVERVEVISSPSARYDASGTAGVINIILKKNKKAGFNGQVQVMAGIPNDTRLNPSLNYKSEKFNFFSTMGMRKSDYEGKYSSNQFTPANNLAMLQDEDRHDDGKMLYAGTDYQLSEKQTMTAAYLWHGTHDHDKTWLNYDYSSLQPDSTLKRSGESREHRNYNQLEYNYTQLFKRPKQKWTVDLQYDWWNSHKNWQLQTDKVAPEKAEYPAIRTNNTNANHDLLIQSDWVQPLTGSLLLEAGLKTENRSIRYSFVAEQQTGDNFTIYDNINNDLRYYEKIQGAYSQLSDKNEKWSYLAGLRMEATAVRFEDDKNYHIPKKAYTWFFPTLHLDYKINTTSQLQVHYSTRISRPSLYQLSPFAELTDLSSREIGNPDLNPSYAHVYELGFLKQSSFITINPTIFYQHIAKPISDYTYRDPEGYFVTIPVNIFGEQRHGFELNFMYNPITALQLNADFNLYRFSQKGSYNGFNFNYTGTSSGGRLTVQVKLPKALGIQTRYYYNGPNSTAQTRIRAMQWVDFGMSKKVLNDRFSIAADATNIFDTRRYRTVVTGQDYSLTTMSRFNGARYRVSLTYKISNDGSARQAKTGNRD
jgi:outer membrane receptor for ferrienterochelin and colicin